MKFAALGLATTMLLASDSSFGDAIRAYREGRFDDALEAFTVAEREVGDSASASLLFDRALAALRAGELRIAEASAEKCAARGSAEFTPLRDFVLGNVEFARCERAEVEAEQPEADPFAWDRAIAHAHNARDSWKLAAMRRRDWPAARRNVERMLEIIHRLEQKRAAAEQRRRTEPDRPKPPKPAPKPKSMSDKLDQNTAQKNAARKDRRGRGAFAGRDW